MNEEDDENTHGMEKEDNIYEYARETLMMEFLDATIEREMGRKH